MELAWEPGNPDAEDEPKVRLRLTDTGVSRTEEFTARDIEDDMNFGRRFRALWDDVLAERIRIQQRRVYESMSENGEG